MDGQKTRDYYRLSADEALDKLRTQATGLTTEEASDRLEHVGPNDLPLVKSASHLSRYLAQFKNPLTLLLIASTITLFLIGKNLPATILVVLIFINTFLRFIQNYQSDGFSKSLAKLLSDDAAVVRNNRLLAISGRELVPGDIVSLEAGDVVPADIRLISSEDLAIDDSIITDDSVPKSKTSETMTNNLPLADRYNLALMGVTVVSGSGRGVVIATGSQTELGQITKLGQKAAPSSSHYQKSTRLAAYSTLALAIVVPTTAAYAGLDSSLAVLLAVAIVLAANPLGLTIEVAANRALAASQLAKIKSRVKKLSAMQNIGATSLILADDNTLSENQPSIDQLLIGQTSYTVAEEILDRNGKKLTSASLHELEIFLAAAVMTCHDEASLGLAQKAGIDPVKLAENYPEIHRLPAINATVHYWQNSDRPYVFTSDTPQKLLAKCSHIWDHGHTRKLTPADKKFILDNDKQLSSGGRQTSALAYRILPKSSDPKKLATAKIERGLTWLGSLSIVDNLRDKTTSAITATYRANIKLSLFTSLDPASATAIATQAGLTDLKIVTSDELDKITTNELSQLAVRGNVIFCHASPETRLQIVHLAQAKHHVVAVTGTSIGDVPALKTADVGLALGSLATNTAKQAADIILLDSSFHALLASIERGRISYQNIKKAVLANAVASSALLLVVLASLALATIFQIPIALSVMDLLAIGLVISLLPLLALGLDKADGSLLSAKPRLSSESILNKKSILELGWSGLLIAVFALANYLWFYPRNNVDPANLLASSDIHWQASSLAFLTIALCLLANIIERRTAKGLFSHYQRHNKWFWLAIIVSLFCLANIIYNPLFSFYFQASSLGSVDWLYALAAAGLFVIIRKFERHTRRHSHHQLIARHGRAKIRHHLASKKSRALAR